MKKILHVIGHLGNGGDTSAVINILNYIDNNQLNNKYKFEFLTHSGYNKEFVDKLRKRNVKIYILDKDARMMGPIKYYKKISKLLKYNKYDAIHMHTSFQSIIGLIAAKRNGIKIRICHSHTSNTIRKTNYLSRKVILPICRFLINIYSTDNVCCGKLAGDFLFGYKSKYKVIYNGIDIEKFKKINLDKIIKIKDKYSITDKNVVIGQVGRFDENKNQEFTVKIAEKLNDNKYLFILIGEGETLNNIKNIVKEKNLKNVYFTDRINNVNEYMYLFNYLLLPTKFGEGLPVTLIEQQIINSNCTCISSDIVTKEANLGKVKYVNLNYIDKWIDIIENSKKEDKMVNYNDFDIKNTAKKWLNLY